MAKMSSLKDCPSHIKLQILGHETPFYVHMNLNSVKRQVSYCTSVISTYTDIQIFTYSTASGLDPSLQSTLFRGHDEGAGISHTGIDNLRPPVCWFLIMPGHSDLT